MTKQKILKGNYNKQLTPQTAEEMGFEYLCSFTPDNQTTVEDVEYMINTYNAQLGETNDLKNNEIGLYLPIESIQPHILLIMDKLQLICIKEYNKNKLQKIKQRIEDLVNETEITQTRHQDVL